MDLIGGGNTSRAQADLDFEAMAMEDEGMFVGGSRPHFAPSDEEVTGARPASPRVAAEVLPPSPTDPDLTPEESARQVQLILGRYTAGLAVDDAERTLILEFGPLARLEEQLGNYADDWLSPEVGDVFKSQIRRAIHEAVVGTPVLSKNEKSQEALEARTKMLELVKALLGSRTTTLANELIAVDAKGVFDFNKQMYGVIDAEQRRIAQMMKNMSPPTLGQTLFEGLKSALVNVGSNELVGNARRHRNKQLSGAIDELTAHASELKSKAGNADWERAEGPMARRAIAQLSGRVHDLTKDVADQVDGPALRKNLDTVQEMLLDASKSSVDAEHKKALEAMVERMAELVQTLVKALGRMFGRSADTPKPA